MPKTINFLKEMKRIGEHVRRQPVDGSSEMRKARRSELEGDRFRRDGMCEQMLKSKRMNYGVKY
jgi:hypothetical protein